jgi:hypothetical protein
MPLGREPGADRLRTAASRARLSGSPSWSEAERKSAASVPAIVSALTGSRQASLDRQHEGAGREERDCSRG